MTETCATADTEVPRASRTAEKTTARAGAATGPDATRAEHAAEGPETGGLRDLAPLVALMRSYGPLTVAFSGGVDSTFLAALCERHLADCALLVHVRSAVVSSPEKRSYERFRASTSLPVVELEDDCFSDSKFVENSARRCYFCKFQAFDRIFEEARGRGFPTVCDGSNADDADDYRPGLQAVAELGVRSPLREAGWTKAQERAWLRAWDVPTWEQPSSACLASRIPYGEPITPQKVACVHACEDFLLERGFRVVRVRLVNWRAQVEVGRDERARLMDPELLDQMDAAFRGFGCKDVLIRARGYSMGSMNDALDRAVVEAVKQANRAR